ncbi:MAG TPA: adenylyl-sulfate kinase, partial [Streptosporangiaceae bacterium]|nr:adenylyl-sulfate kinase [Streptosporangiaceae bacterium]
MTDIDGTAAPDLPAELAHWPALTLDEGQQGELELITSGAFTPVDGYLTGDDLARVAADGTLADGTPWPVPVTLTVAAGALPAGALPAGALPPGADRLVLQDAEGSPLAVLSITEASREGDLLRLAGPVIALRPPEHGPFRGLRRTPGEVRTAVAGSGAVLAYPTRRPLHRRQIGQLRHYATAMNARLLVLPLINGPVPVVRRPEALIRTVLAAATQLPAGTLVVPVPLPRYGGPAEDLRAAGIVAAAYGATHLLTDSGPAGAAAGAGPTGPGAANGRNGPVMLPGVPIPVIVEPEWAFDPRSEVWRPLALIEPGAERTELSDDELLTLLDSGNPLPDWFTPAGVAAELRRVRPPRSRRGLVVFFTGLSGSGKSTIARGLAEALAERGDRTVSLLDGDHVRRLLSAGLTFSRADRDLNISRIGFVATEVARHGGVAICAPIAPYAAARAAVREMVAETGDFLLVYVSTPVDVCADRDRKGLYAKARAGLLD